MTEAEVLECLGGSSGWIDRLESWPAIMADGQVEADWAAASAAIVAIALAQCSHALLILLAPEFPRVQTFQETGNAHAFIDNRCSVTGKLHPQILMPDSSAAADPHARLNSGGSSAFMNRPYRISEGAAT